MSDYLRFYYTSPVASSYTSSCASRPAPVWQFLLNRNFLKRRKVGALLATGSFLCWYRTSTGTWDITIHVIREGVRLEPQKSSAIWPAVGRFPAGLATHMASHLTCVSRTTLSRIPMLCMYRCRDITGWKSLENFLALHSD
uniref:Uncharacterized protein n=1 Tax=Romanomermis culicivorax TaxID=13658 RepID=A0A915IUE2_ROMCU